MKAVFTGVNFKLRLRNAVYLENAPFCFVNNNVGCTGAAGELIKVNKFTVTNDLKITRRQFCIDRWIN